MACEKNIACTNPEDFPDISGEVAPIFVNSAVSYVLEECPTGEGWLFTGTPPGWVSFDDDRTFSGAPGVWVGETQEDATAIAQAQLDAFVEAQIAASSLTCATWTPELLAIQPRNWWDAAFLTGFNDLDEVDDVEDRGTANWKLHTAATGPIYRTNQLNGLPGLNWQGATTSAMGITDSLNSDITTFVNQGLSGMMIFGVVDTVNVASGELFSTRAAGPNNAWIVAEFQPGGPNLIQYGNKRAETQLADSTNTGPNVYSANTPLMVMIDFRWSVATKACWVNATQISFDGSFQNVGVTSGSEDFSRIGQGVASAGKWDGFIYEIVVLDYTLVDADRERVEGYLAWKWGIEGDLPIGHPYKNSPPLP